MIRRGGGALQPKVTREDALATEVGRRIAFERSLVL